MTDEIDGTPVIECRQSKNGRTWSFECPHCRCRHTHGAMPGHRVAHCYDAASPFKATGYILTLGTEGSS